MADGLNAIEGVEVINRIWFTQVMFAGRDDATTAEIGRRLHADGTAAFTPATWQGRPVQRCSVSNWSTTVDDIRRTVEAVARIVASLRGGAP
jgi:hypothetical protein